MIHFWVVSLQVPVVNKFCFPYLVNLKYNFSYSCIPNIENKSKVTEQYSTSRFHITTGEDLGDEFHYLLKCNYFNEKRKTCIIFKKL